MALRDIMLDGRDNVLRKIARPLTQVTPAIDMLLDDMAETMYYYKGVGLAAPQIGILKRLIIADAGQELIKLMNPVILHTEGMQTGRESCLSIPDVTGVVNRPEKIIIDAVNSQGKHVTMTYSGILARIVCHEIDHLDGVLFTDRVEPGSIIYTSTTDQQNNI